MNAQGRYRFWVPTLGSVLLLAASAAPAAVSMQGEVTLDYYVADVDPDGFEQVDSELYVERVHNDSASASGPLSLAGWLTGDPNPAGDGTTVAEAPIGTIPGSSDLLAADEVVPADDAAPGEYYVHMLLQDDRFPGSYEDSRSLTPTLLWRGGLEAVGPLTVSPYGGGYYASVDFSELRNNRLDARYTGDIELTLFATHGFGPASDGHTLCTRTVSGLYAGDSTFQAGFDCPLAAIPDGEYTLHLEVAEAGGRGGYSTLSGPDLRFVNGHVTDGIGDGYLYVTGALDFWTTLPLLALSLAGIALRRRTS